MGVTCAYDFIESYFREDNELVESYYGVGAVPGFFYYDIEDVEQEKIRPLREELQARIQEVTGDAVTFTGGATAPTVGYLDFIAWDFTALLKAAKEVFGFCKAEPRMVLKGEEPELMGIEEIFGDLKKIDLQYDDIEEDSTHLIMACAGYADGRHETQEAFFDEDGGVSESHQQ